MFFSKRKQHDIGRRRSNENRSELGDHDVAGEVDAGGLEHALSTTAVGNVRRNDAASVPPLDEEARSFLCASLVLPSLLATPVRPGRTCGAPEGSAAERSRPQLQPLQRRFPHRESSARPMTRPPARCDPGSTKIDEPESTVKAESYGLVAEQIVRGSIMKLLRI